MLRRSLSSLAVTCLLATTIVQPAPQALADPRHPIDLLNCIRPTFDNFDVLFGPTDVSAATGNGRLSAAINDHGTLTVMRWPSPSYFDHVKFFTTGREQPLLGALGNEGVFTGVRWTDGDGTVGFFWLRDAGRIEQQFLDDRTDTTATTFEHEASGLRVQVFDTVDPDDDVLVRRHRVEAVPGSPVASVRLVSFANLNVTFQKLAGVPMWDTCLDQLHDAPARWDPDADSVVQAGSGWDESIGRNQDVASAYGWAEQSAAHDVTPDRMAWHFPVGDRDAYEQATATSGGLRDRGYAQGQVDAAVATDVSLTDGAGEATFLVAFGEKPADATALLTRARETHADVITRKQTWWANWLASAALPNTDDPDIMRHALRALISLRQAYDRDRGGIVASITTQPPYNVAWTRDGAYFNEAFFAAGHPDMAVRNGRFYDAILVRHDQKPRYSFLTPVGNWPMTMYLDGATGGPIPFEIDETGFGLWTIVRGYEETGDVAYLQDVYASIRAAADFLAGWRNPFTRLPLPAWEDDNPIPVIPPSLTSSTTVLLGLRAAVTAATALGRTSDATKWRARADELDRAIERRYKAEEDPLAYGLGSGGSYVIWPLRFRSYDSDRIEAQAEIMWENVAPQFEAPGGERKSGAYEAKTLLSLAHVWAETDPDRLEDVRRGLRWLATVPITPGTGISGEGWYVEDDFVRTVVAQPHVWNMTLFYLTSLLAYP